MGLIVKNQPLEIKVIGDKGYHQFSVEVESDTEAELPVKGSCGCITLPDSASKFKFVVGTNHVTFNFNKSYCPDGCLKTIKFNNEAYPVKVKR